LGVVEERVRIPNKIDHDVLSNCYKFTVG